MKFSNALRCAALLSAALPLTTALSAATVYYTNFAGRQIYSLDTVSHATTLIDTVPGAATGNPDSLIFDSAGRIIYTMYNGSPGTLRAYDPSNNTDVLIASGFGNNLVDVTLEPGLTTVLVSDRGNNAIKRVVLATGATTTLGTYSTPDGLTYDNAGNLYAAIGGIVDKIDPVTGAVLTTGSNGAGFLDGVTYDPVSDKLYSATGSCLYSIDKTTLVTSACINTPGFSGNDGVESDGLGNLYFAASGSNLVGEYNIAGGTFTTVSNNLGSLDDIAPAAGLGAPPPTTPEPATTALMGLGCAILGFVSWRRKARTA